MAGDRQPNVFRCQMALLTLLLWLLNTKCAFSGTLLSSYLWSFPLWFEIFFPFCLPRCIYLIVVSKQHLNFIIICEAEDNNMYSTHFSLFYLSVASSPSYVSYFILLVFTDWKVWHKCTIMMLTQLCVIIYQSIIWYIYVIINHFISIL